MLLMFSSLVLKGLFYESVMFVDIEFWFARWDRDLIERYKKHYRLYFYAETSETLFMTVLFTIFKSIKYCLLKYNLQISGN